MKRMMIFKQLFYDLQRLDGRTSLSFFQETDEEHESVTSMTEDQAVKWLFRDASFKQMFLDDFFENRSRVKCYFGLKEPFTEKNKKPGDIDLLLVDTERPDRAIAFECKRVKATSLDEKTSKVNNAQKIKQGVVQANKYQSLGFHQSYLMIILLDDGRHYKTPNIMFRQTETDEVKHIYDIPWNERLNNDVGIIFIRVNQITGKHINLGGGIGFCIDREAEPLDQTVSMTNKIKELLRTYSNASR